MADLVLSGGREITFDLGAIREREYRALFRPNQPVEEEDAILARVSGLSADELLDLSKLDFKRLIQAFFRKVREPLADPN